MKLEMLHDMMVEKLQDLYSAENQLVDALPMMAKGAWSNNLRRLLLHDLEQTAQHITRLEQIFRHLEVSASGRICKPMARLFDDAQMIIERDGSPDIVDSALIIVALKMKDYEIAGYAKVGTYAEILGQEMMQTLILATLDEEQQIDAGLLKQADTIAKRLLEQDQAAASVA